MLIREPWLTACKAAFWGAAVAVLWLALSPVHTQPAGGWDKVNHLLAFGLLGLLAAACWPGRLPRHLLLLFAYGVCIEFLQGLFPGRHPDPWDVAANAMGLLLAAAAAACVGRRRAAARAPD